MQPRKQTMVIFSVVVFVISVQAVIVYKIMMGSFSDGTAFSIGDVMLGDFEQPDIAARGIASAADLLPRNPLVSKESVNRDGLAAPNSVDVSRSANQTSVARADVRKFLELLPPMKEAAANPSVQKKEVCVIARTYNGHSGVVILSFVSSIYKAMRAADIPMRIFFAITDAYPFNELVRIVLHMNSIFAKKFLFISPRTLVQAAKHINPNNFNISRDNDYGFIVTDLVMEDLLIDPGCEYFLVTNADNLYTPAFFVKTMEQLVKGYDAVATHFISRYNFTEEIMDHQNLELDCGIFEPGAAHEFRTSFRQQCIDLGAAVFTKNIVKRTGVRFMVNDLRHKQRDEFFATVNAFRDGLFFEVLKNHSARTHVIEEVLFVHQ